MGHIGFPARLERLPVMCRTVDALEIREARTFRARLLGLALLAGLPPGKGLLLARTRCVHTFWMRFAVDLAWVDRAGRVVRIDEAVAPWRLRGCRRARSVVELGGGQARRAGLLVGARALDGPGGPSH